MKKKLILLPIFALLLAGCGKTDPSVPPSSEGGGGIELPSSEELLSDPSSEKESIPEGEFITIEEARALADKADSNVTVKGTITEIYGMAESTFGVIIQEGTYALTLTFVKDVSDLKIGDYVAVTGKTKIFNGLYQVGNTTITKLDEEAPVITPLVITEWSNEVLKGKDAVQVVVDGLKYVGGSITVGANSPITVKLGDVEFDIYMSQYIDRDIQEALKAKFDSVTINDTIKFTGAVGMHNNYQLNPLRAETIEITKGEAVTLSALGFNPAAKELKVGDEYKAGATLVVTPNGAPIEGLVYASSDPEVATVDAAGKVTAVKAGSATITAKVGEIVGELVLTVAEASEVVEYDYVETFDLVTSDGSGYTSTDSYEDANGFYWSMQGRADGVFTDDSKAWILGNAKDNSFVQVVANSGISSFSVDVVRAFGNANKRTLELFVNDTSYGTFNVDASSDEVQNWTVENINVPGRVTIKVVSTNTGKRGATLIDNFSWTKGPEVSFGTLASLEIDYDDVKVDYFTGEKFSSYGLLISAFDNSDPANEKALTALDVTITFADTVFNETHIGKQEVVVSYTEGEITVTASFEIEVKAWPYAHAGTEADPFDVEDALAAAELTGETNSDPYYVKGIISVVKEVSAQFGNAEFYIVNAEGDTESFYIYRVKISGTQGDEIVVGAEVVVYGSLVNYQGNTLQMKDGGVITSITAPLA